MVRLTDRPDMTLDVYRGRKTTMQQKVLLIFMNLILPVQEFVKYRGRQKLHIDISLVIKFKNLPIFPKPKKKKKINDLPI